MNNQGNVQIKLIDLMNLVSLANAARIIHATGQTDEVNDLIEKTIYYGGNRALIHAEKIIDEHID